MPYVRPYLVLIEAFLEGRLTASHFETTFLHMFTNDQLMSRSREFEILNELFYSVDAYCADPLVRAGTSDGVDQVHLRSATKKALDDLIRIVEDQALDKSA